MRYIVALTALVVAFIITSQAVDRLLEAGRPVHVAEQIAE